MRFIDYNGSGGLDQQDIATSIVVEEAAREEDQLTDSASKRLEANTGCATLAAFIALSVLALIAAL